MKLIALAAAAAVLVDPGSSDWVRTPDPCRRTWRRRGSKAPYSASRSGSRSLAADLYVNVKLPKPQVRS